MRSGSGARRRPSAVACPLRIEDHDRQRSRAQFERAILEDLAWLGFRADSGPFHQAADPAPYDAAIERLRAVGLVYACDCTRTTVAAWATEHGGRRWSGPGCPGRCHDRALPEGTGLALRVALGGGEESFEDLRLGRRSGAASPDGDLVVRDRHGDRTYHLCVVVDDARQGIDARRPGRGPARVHAEPAPAPAAPRRDAAPVPSSSAHPSPRRRASSASPTATPASASCEDGAGRPSGSGPRPRTPPAFPGDGADAGPGDGRLSLGPVLDLPGVIEGVPGDPMGGVARRPLAIGERPAVGRPAKDLEHGRSERVDRRSIVG